MPDRYEVVESATTTLPLAADQAEALRALGRILAGKGRWWGSGTDEAPASSVISVVSAGAAGFTVRVSDAVGVIAAPGVQIVVQPKIPAAHLLPLLVLGDAEARGGAAPIHFRLDDSLWDVIVAWFLREVEAILRRDLIRDYRLTRERLTVVRGRVALLPTIRSALQGRVAIDCSFDEFDANTPLNRVLLAALRAVLRAPVTATASQRRARQLSARFEDVSALQPADLAAAFTDRRTAHYADALALARLLLRSEGVDLEHGRAAGWAFLIRTPEAVEAGLRTLLKRALTGHSVTKEGRQLPGSTKTLNPDLVFDGGLAVGDIKYKLHHGDWANDDLYQVVAFATGYEASRALLASFSKAQPPLQPLQVGKVRVTHVVWEASPEASFGAAAAAFTGEVSSWLREP